MHEIAFICPTYNHFVYAHHAVQTFFEYSPQNSICFLIDDASPEWQDVDWKRFYQGLPRERIVELRSKTNRGLTHSWNWGLRKARDMKATYTICGNSDILFTQGWYQPMIHHLENTDRVEMTGPVSNAAGITAKGAQSITKYISDYKNSDSQEYLNRLAKRLRSEHGGEYTISPSGVNGFFQFAKTATWWKYAFDSRNPYRPRNDYNSKGGRNPTPLMTLNEDELQRRWRSYGALSGVVVDSFIFHYRAVSRGKKYLRGKWARMSQKRRGS